MDEEDGGGPRIGLIRSAVRTIRSGTRGVDAVFAEARGPLPKSAVRSLHQRIKELRKTAELTEGAFREWTLDLVGRPRGAEHAEHDELRAAFEAEVAGIQQSMLRVAGEVKRRKASRKGAEEEEAAAESEAGEDPPQSPPPSTAAAPPAPPPAATPPPAAAVAAAAPAPVPPPRRAPARTAEERASSHAAMASTLQLIASQEEEVRRERTPQRAEHQTVQLAPRSSMPLKEKMAGMHPYMKYVVGAALVIVGYTLYSHARLVILQTSIHAPGTMPAEAVPPALPAIPRRLR